METTTQLVHRFTEVRAEVDALDAKLKAVKKQSDVMSLEILERFADDNVQKMTVNDRTVFSKRQLWAGHTNKEDKSVLIDALKSHESTAALVTEEANSMRLSSFARELDQDDDGVPIMPDHLEGKMNVFEKFSVACRKA